MSNMTRDFFYALSTNQILNSGAKKWGLKLGASKVVAGIDIPSMTQSIRELNKYGISATIDHLGEFISLKSEAEEAKLACMEILETIHSEKLDAHLSVKLTQLGLDIDEQFCLDNMLEIANVAKKYDIFINLDMEDYAHYEPTLRVMNELRKSYENIGTVIQAYLFRVEEDLEEMKDVRVRLVKGAYKEDPAIAWQSKADIDRNFIKLIKQRLLNGTLTSIATHDHNVIDEVKRFVEENGISKESFEFQMLYGFRYDMQLALAKEGYHFCVYVPYGEDWYGYFMRRLAERPENLNLVLKSVTHRDNGQMRLWPVAAAGVGAYLLGRALFGKKKR